MDYDWSFMKCHMKYCGFMALAGLILGGGELSPLLKPPNNYALCFSPLPWCTSPPMPENGQGPLDVFYRSAQDLIADCYRQTVDAGSSYLPSQTEPRSSRIRLVTHKAFRHSDGGCRLACVGQPNRVIRNLGQEPHS